MRGEQQRAVLLFRAGTRLCALPIEHVVETMRPLPIETVAGAPAAVRGLATVRGAPVPVIDVAALLGSSEPSPGRFVTVNAAGRVVALAVAEVIGTRVLQDGLFVDLPALLEGAANDAVDAVGVLDAELVLLLRSGRLVPDDVWAGLAPADGH